MKTIDAATLQVRHGEVLGKKITAFRFDTKTEDLVANKVALATLSHNFDPIKKFE
jgi:hypothetical protein